MATSARQRAEAVSNLGTGIGSGSLEHRCLAKCSLAKCSLEKCSLEKCSLEKCSLGTWHHPGGER
jgi:hypothetical protein